MTSNNENEGNAFEGLSDYIINKNGPKTIRTIIISSIFGLILILVVGYRELIKVELINSPLNAGVVLWISFVFLAIFFGLWSSANKNVIRMRNGANYPTQHHIYFPFDMDFYNEHSTEQYKKAKTKPNYAYTDPFYINRVIPNWTTLAQFPPYVRWIPAESGGNSIDGLYFAILPINLAAYPGGSIMFRLFMWNRSNGDKKYELKFIYGKNLSGRQLPKKIIRSILETTVKSNQTIYRDIAIPVPQSTSGKVETIYFLDWWQKKERVNGKTVSINYHQILTTLVYITSDPPANQEWLKMLQTMGLHYNPFISPAGIKSILIFALTRGNIVTSLEYKNWYSNLGVKKTLLNLLGLIIIFASLALSIIFFGFYTSIITLLILATVSRTNFLQLYSKNKSNQLLYDHGLTKSPNYLSHQDTNIAIEDNDQLFQILSLGEKLQEASVPVDFCLPLAPIIRQSQSTREIQDFVAKENKKRFYYAQFQYRLKQVNLPSLYHIPYFEIELSEIKIEFKLDIPDRHVPLLDVIDDVRKSIKVTKSEGMQVCTNCNIELRTIFAYCQYCGSKVASSS